MTSECPNPECDIAGTGVCAVHNVEVERRKHMSELVQNIPKMLTMLHRLIGIMTYASIALSAAFIFAASAFVYTWKTSQEINQNNAVLETKLKDTNDRLEKKIERLVDQANTTMRTVSINEYKHNNLVEELEKLNSNIRSILLQYHGVGGNNGAKE